jgi:hypothetical protein
MITSQLLMSTMQNQEVILIDRDVGAEAGPGAGAGAARVDAQQFEGERLAAEDETVSKILCSQLGWTKRARKDGVRLCHVHGLCKRCNYQDCNNLEQQGGLCVRHGSKKKT